MLPPLSCLRSRSAGVLLEASLAPGRLFWLVMKSSWNTEEQGVGRYAIASINGIAS
jgi:hypothetical protein